MITVLVTCVGSGVGQSVIDSLNLKREFKIIGCDGNPNVYAHSYCDEFIVVPGLYSEGYSEHILDLCIENKVDILIPGHDHELVIFARDYNKFKNAGIEVLVSEPNIIAISRDKQNWYDFFAPLGCKIVPTLSVRDYLLNPNSSILPAIVKPSGGSASQGISIINTLEDLRGLKEEDIIQPYLFPEESDSNYHVIVNAVQKGQFLQMSEISIQLIFSAKSKFSGIFISKNSLKNGVPVFVDPIDPSKFEYLDEIMKFVPILESHGVKGPVNIQGRVTPKGLYFFEMNMRFTGITGNRALLGFNEVDFLTRNFLGLEAKLDDFAYNKVGVRQVACSTIPRQISHRKELETITILGGGSNIGKEFIIKRSSDFKSINLIVRESSLAKYKELFSTISNVKLICQDDVNLEQALCQSDVLINFVSALAFQDDSSKYEALLYLQNISNKIAKAKIEKVINISSQSVYSQTLDENKGENFPIQYCSSYAFQKVMIERLFSSIKEFSPESKVISLRLPRVIIPQISGQSGFFGRIVENFKNGTKVEIEFPESKTNIIHINDVINALSFVLKSIDTSTLPGIINVAGNNISMKEYVSLVIDNVEGIGEVKLGDSKEVKSSSMINGELINSLGWSAEYSVVDIIKELE
ncbi:NAD-dependent epimerase/dehydratase family protein [Myroides sp. LJL116]